MNKNMGRIDRGLRTSIAILIGALYLAGELSGTMALIFGIVAVAFLLTSTFGVCPLYRVLKLTTIPKD